MEGEWTTRDGSKIRFVDMTPGHLRNAARMLRRQVERDIDEGYRMLSLVRGEMASDAIESQINVLLDGDDHKSQLAADMERLAEEKEA